MLQNRLPGLIAAFPGGGGGSVVCGVNAAMQGRVGRLLMAPTVYMPQPITIPIS